MGFNNGYDSGYADAEAAFAAERTALQAEIRKLKAASGGTPASAATPGGSGSVPSALNIPPIRTLSPDITNPEVNIPGLLESNADIVLASDASSVSVLDGDSTGLNMSAITVTSELGNAVANLPVGAVLVAPVEPQDYDTSYDVFLQFTYNGVPILPADVDMFEDAGVRARLANAGTLVADSSPTFIVIQRTATGFQGYSFYA